MPKATAGLKLKIMADLDIIVPLFNEEENVLPLADEIAANCRSVPFDVSLILIDDCSTDSTWQRIGEASRKYPFIRAIRHKGNCGQSAALWTGIQASSSPLIATLDGDLQNDPSDLPRLLQELKGADCVCGVRTRRRDSWLRRVSSRIARRARRRALGVDFSDTGCALRVFRRSAIQQILPFNGFHRFLPILVHSAGGRVKEIPVNHRPRLAGLSKYGVCNRLFRGIYDLVGLSWYQRRMLRRVPCEEMRLPAARECAVA